MKTYLVGGAVRDKLLGIEPKRLGCGRLLSGRDEISRVYTSR